MKRVPSDLSRWPTLSYGAQKLPSPPAVDRTAIVLGRDNARMPVLLPEKSRLEHTFILGATGSGKSRGQFQIARQAITKGEGLLWVDPHGTDDFRDLLVWLSGTEKRTHVIDFKAPNVMGFNPLACPEGTDPSVIVGNAMDALAAGWEGESLAAKPTIERVMSAMFAALVELNLTVCEAPTILDHTDAQGLRRHAIQNIKDDYSRSVLMRLHELSEDPRRKRDFDQEVVGPENRLARLLRPPTIRAMLGQTKNCIDLKAVMDNGEIILANLSGGTQVYEKDADLFGRLLVRSVLFHSKRRDNTNTFGCMLDEAHRYLSGDLPVLLAEVRKYAVAITAAIQWLRQAEAVDENILAALLNGTNVKICFRLRDAEEAERMARSLIRLNLERPVEALIKPTVIGHQRTLLKNSSESEQHSNTKNRSLALGETETHGVATSTGVTRGRSVTDGTSDVESNVDISSKSRGNVTGEGASASEIMIPTDDPSNPIISRTTAGASNSNSKSSGSTTGKAHGRAKGKNHSVTDSNSESSSEAISKSLGRSKVATEGEGETIGFGKSSGHSEALEPIMAPLPTAVHSMQNELYAAGQLLCSLKRSTGYLSYVGRRGPVATLFQIPFINVPQVSDSKFIELRNRMMAEAVPLEEALQMISNRASQSPVKPARPAVKLKPQRPSNPQDDHGEAGIY